MRAFGQADEARLGVARVFERAGYGLAALMLAGLAITDGTSAMRVHFAATGLERAETLPAPLRELATTLACAAAIARCMVDEEGEEFAKSERLLAGCCRDVFAALATPAEALS